METIQFTDQGLFLPRKLLAELGEIKIVQGDDYVLIKSKTMTAQFKEGERTPVSVHEPHETYELSLLEKTDVTEEPSLYDVWRLLIATATRLDQLYTTLDIAQESLSLGSSAQPTGLHVREHPFFGMNAEEPGDVPGTMARLRENRYVAL